ncbi:ABC transporter permease [Melioribacter sp. OK-6-Me]|uniref:ABC transporter permease n=1 Tax=unclassified Melioribacter TaxID=2627329 RepID=UPI003ED8A5E1
MKGNGFATVIHFIIKEFQQLKRDPKMFAIVLAAPVLQTIILGYAATFDVNNVDFYLLDRDKSSASRKYVEKIINSGYFTIKGNTENYEEIENAIMNGKAVMGLIIPREFEKGIENNNGTKVQVIVDGSDGNKGSIAFGYIQAITAAYAKTILLDKIERNGIRVPLKSVDAETRIWYNPELKTRVFMVPGITALLLMIITTLLTSLAIVKEKEFGTLEQLIVTPIKPWQMILGKILPFTILGLIMILLVNSVMIFWFGIPIRGSILFFFFASLLFILSTLGIGLFISTVSRTQQQAMMVTVFGATMPMIYLSGFVFPIENMPRIIQYVTYIIPLKYFITIIRGVILKGIGIADLWQETLILALMGTAILFLAAKRFHKRLE